MRSSLFISTAVAALATSVQAVGKVTIANNCDPTLHVFSTSQDGTIWKKAAIGSYSEKYRGEGIAIKISDSAKQSSIFDGTPLVTFQYTLDGNKVYYSTSRTNGDLLHGGKITVVASSGTPNSDVRTFDDENRVKTTGANSNLHVTLCA